MLIFYWFQFATDRDVFLFDILELPPECFEEGIKAILENPDVLKVSTILVLKVSTILVVWHDHRWITVELLCTLLVRKNSIYSDVWPNFYY